MGVKLVNLTPHPITVYDESGNILMNVPPSGQVVRVSTTSRIIDNVDNIPIREVQYGDIQGLPEPQEGVVYIVSTIVVLALKAKGINRVDVVSPDTSQDSVIRDNEGKIIGVKYFQR